MTETEQLKLKNKMLDECDHVIGGWWGNKIQYFGDASISGKPEEIADIKKRLVGWLPHNNRIEPGHLVFGEYERSFVLFEIVKVDWKSNPSDMFFADARVHKMITKEDGDTIFERDSTPVRQQCFFAGWF